MAFLINGTQVVDNSRSIDAVGISTLEDLRVTGVTTTVDFRVTGVGTMAELKLGTDPEAYSGVSLDVENDAPATKLASASAIKSYVDNEITNVNNAAGAANLTILADGANSTDVNLSNGELNFTSGSNVNLAITAGALPEDTDSLDISLTADPSFNSVSATASISGDSLAATNGITGASIQLGASQLVNEVVTDVSGGTDSQLPTAAAVQTAIDNVQSNLDAANQLSFTGDGGTVGEIDLSAPETLDFQGTPDQIVTAVDSVGGNQISFALAATTKITTGLVIGEGNGSGGSFPDVFSADASGTRISGDLNVGGNVDSASDIKLKENIEVIPNALEKIEALRGVEYTWKSNGAYSAGIIAQEVMAVMPGLVTDNETHLSVQYNGLIGLLIEGMKEQSARIAELEAKLG